MRRASLGESAIISLMKESTIRLEIKKLAYGGEGLGFPDGKACFVEGVLPGETVEAKIFFSKKNFARGKPVKIISPSPARITPPCQYYPDCGGCQYQHVSYAEELKWKETQVREFLTANLKTNPRIIHSTVPSPQEYGYRTSVTIQRPMSENNGNPLTGFIGKDNHSVIAVDKCLLLKEKLNMAFNICQDNPAKYDKMTFRIAQDGKIYSDEQNEFFQMKPDHQPIWTHSKCFFQNNLAVTARIGNQISKWIETSRSKSFWDLYAGVGTFTVLSANKKERIYCIESNKYAISALKLNTVPFRENVEIHSGDVEAVFPGLYRKSEEQQSSVFLDPPRQGIRNSLAELIAGQNGIKTLIYLSCHLGTLARDLKLILSKNRYTISEVVPFDMFPRTKHIEIAVLLHRTQ